MTENNDELRTKHISYYLNNITEDAKEAMNNPRL